MSATNERIYALEDVEQEANWLLQTYPNRRIFCFKGDLGSGKTTFISSLCKILGCVDQVSSPTFSIVNQYNANGKVIYHFDLYRLKNLEEAMDIGLEEYLYSGNYCFIEWPEKVTNILPDSIVVSCELIYHSIDKRRLSVC